MVVRGDPQSSILHSNALISNVKMEIRTGFQFPLRLDNTFKIKGAIVSPLGMVVQSTLDNDGNTVPKYRPTHDHSFDFSEENSLNNRLAKDDLPPLCYGFCLLRLLHYIYSLRLAEPTKHMLMSKIDVKSASSRHYERRLGSKKHDYHLRHVPPSALPTFWWFLLSLPIVCSF